MPISILNNISLARYTTFKIGGPAKFFVVAKSALEIEEAVRWAIEYKEKYLILGGGSNLLIADEGFNGLVIKIQNTQYQVQDTSITVGAGMLLGQAVALAARHNLTGLEWAAGIPGTIGGAVRGNAGAVGGEMSQIVKSVMVFEDESMGELPNRAMEFNYRESIFKHAKKHCIIIEAKLALTQGDKRESLELIKKYSRLKKDVQPLAHPSAGCAFKNYGVTQKDQELFQKHPELLNMVKNNSISAGWLIDQCGLKGTTVGGAMISDTHANFILNTGTASARDVLELLQRMKTKVKEKFGIELEEEIQII